MDNCWRENKNHFVFGFVAWLVLHRRFSEVKTGFLMVGHTHHDNDQFFSGIGNVVKRKNALTWPDFLQLLSHSHPELAVSVQSLETMPDFSAFIGPFMNNIINISRPHHFHFCRREGTVNFRSRMFKDTQWSEWMPVFKQQALPSQTELFTVSRVKVRI